MASFDHNRRDLSPYGFSCTTWSPAIMRRPDRHNEIELNFLKQGWVSYLLGGKVVRVESGHLAAFWAAVPHQIIAHGDGADYYVMTIPLAWFLRCRLPEGFVQALLNGRLINASGSYVLINPRILADWEEDLRQSPKSPARATLLEVESRLRRLARGFLEEHPAVRAHDRRPVLLPEGCFAKAEQMADLVARRYTEHLTTESFSKETRLNRQHAMLLFQQVFGTTLVNYVTLYRISHAQRLLVASEKSVIEVAGEAGFGSLSNFNRAFQRYCHCTPREYRQRHSLVERAAGCFGGGTGMS